MTNLWRKVFHLSGVGIVLVYRAADLSRPVAAGVLAGIALALLLLDLLRVINPAIQERFRAMFGLILDPKDLQGLNGSTLYLGGCALAVALFPMDAACGGILALAVGDPCAAIVGSSVRSPRLGRVSLAGTGACLLAAAAACWTIVTPPKALVGGAVAAAVEAVAGSKLDNLAIPLGVALALHVL
ncbi:MAG: hypothetical protein ACREID_01210 [Planctomycetota bacterium]